LTGGLGESFHPHKKTKTMKKNGAPSFVKERSLLFVLLYFIFPSCEPFSSGLIAPCLCRRLFTCGTSCKEPRNRNNVELYSSKSSNQPTPNELTVEKNNNNDDDDDDDDDDSGFQFNDSDDNNDYDDVADFVDDSSIDDDDAVVTDIVQSSDQKIAEIEATIAKNFDADQSVPCFLV
jgi:hypothetical protein